MNPIQGEFDTQNRVKEAMETSKSSLYSLEAKLRFEDPLTLEEALNILTKISQKKDYYQYRPMIELLANSPQGSWTFKDDLLEFYNEIEKLIVGDSENLKVALNSFERTTRSIMSSWEETLASDIFQLMAKEIQVPEEELIKLIQEDVQKYIKERYLYYQQENNKLFGEESSILTERRKNQKKLIENFEKMKLGLEIPNEMRKTEDNKFCLNLKGQEFAHSERNKKRGGYSVDSMIQSKG